MFARFELGPMIGKPIELLHFLVMPVMSYSNMARTLEDHNALDEVTKGQEEVDHALV